MHEIFGFITLFCYDSLKKSELLWPIEIKSALDALVFRNLVFCICTQWSEFLATDTEVPGSIPGATRFSE